MTSGRSRPIGRCCLSSERTVHGPPIMRDDSRDLEVLAPTAGLERTTKQEPASEDPLAASKQPHTACGTNPPGPCRCSTWQSSVQKATAEPTNCAVFRDDRGKARVIVGVFGKQAGLFLNDQNETERARFSVCSFCDENGQRRLKAYLASRSRRRHWLWNSGGCPVPT